MAGNSKQHEAVQREFTRQASGFETVDSLFGDVAILEWIASQIDIPDGARFLDVAGGTGQLGRHLARTGGSAVIVDLTEAMLATGLRSALERDQDNVVFVHGDACELPFPDGQFDVVVCRFALHHMDEAARAVAEMARVCRPDGTVTLIDMVSGRGRHDELERLRDPSHTRALTAAQMRDALAAAGRTPRRTNAREHTAVAETWLERAHTSEHEREIILAALQQEAEGGDATGLRASLSDGRLTITQRWMLVGD